MEKCIFCGIATKEIPADILYEDAHCILFLDLHPASEGHSLLVPKKHFTTLADMPAEESKSIIISLQQVATKFLSAYDGMNILQNNKRAAGQIVDHFHIHLIPRMDGDNLHIGSHPSLSLSQEKMKSISTRIKKLFKE